MLYLFLGVILSWSRILKISISILKNFIIKVVNSTWIANKILFIINVDPNIFKEALNTILEENSDIKI
jgi:hypothetical protein